MVKVKVNISNFKEFFSKIMNYLIILIPVFMTILLPITIFKIIIPFIFRPDVFGDIPWFTPSSVSVTFFYYFFLTIFVYLFSILSCTLQSIQKCQKTSFLISAKYGTFVISWLWLGIILINTILLPYGKAVLLSLLRIPYSLYFVDGLLLTPFVYLGTLLATANSNYDICKN